MTAATRRRAHRFHFIPIAAAAGLGMLGAVTAVRAATPVNWDLLVTVAPTIPYAQPTSEDRIRVVVSGLDAPLCAYLVFEPPIVSDKIIRLQGRRVPSSIMCFGNRWYQEVELPRLPPTPANWLPYRLEVYDEDLLIHQRPIEVFAPARWLHLLDLPADGVPKDYLNISVRLTDPAAGPARDAGAAYMTREAGYFWFFDPDNVEVTVKVVDGHPVNGHNWLFITGMSNLGFTVTVQPGRFGPGPASPTRTYVNPPGQRLNVIDTELP